MTSEDDAWAQTIITVTPEDDATLREISETAVLSSTSDTTLVLDADEIVYRRSFTNRQFIEVESVTEETDLEQTEQIIKQDAENQTYLQGTSVVHISIEYKDEASQTMYMSSPCPPLAYFKDIMTSMNEGPMPTVKTTNATSTILSFHPETPQHSAMEQLSVDVTEQELEEFVSKLNNDEEAEIEMRDIVHFLLARTFWIVDPTTQAPVQTIDNEAQTYIKYNYHTKTFLTDVRIQTDLTCEPKKSNTNLLAAYWETKNMISKYLEDSIFQGIETRIIVDEMMNEIIDKCSERIKYPMKHQVTQTIATCKLDGEKEEDVLRKLRLDVIVDPLEASIIVVPLMDDLLGLVYDGVCKNSVGCVNKIVNAIYQRTMIIIVKLAELQTETKPKPMEQILAHRRKRILDSMLMKKTGTISTQTSIVGISEVKRVKESKEIVCSVCRQHSACQYCVDQEIGDVPQQEYKLLRTQDILLAYKPCYIVTKASEKEKNLDLVEHIERKPKPILPALQVGTVATTKKSNDTINVLLQPENKVKPKESVNEWSYVVNATLLKRCSVTESINEATITSTKSSSKSCYQDTRCLRSNLDLEQVNALQILKETFCNQENCAASSIQGLNKSSSCHGSGSERISTCDTSLSISSINTEIFEGDVFCKQQNGKAISKLHLSKTNNHSRNNCPQVCKKSRDNGFKIIPLCLSQDSDT